MAFVENRMSPKCPQLDSPAVPVRLATPRSRPHARSSISDASSIPSPRASPIYSLTFAPKALLNSLTFPSLATYLSKNPLSDTASLTPLAPPSISITPTASRRSSRAGTSTLCAPLSAPWYVPNSLPTSVNGAGWSAPERKRLIAGDCFLDKSEGARRTAPWANDLAPEM